MLDFDDFDFPDDYLDAFAEHADADELMVCHASPTVDLRLRSVDLLADGVGLVAA